MEHRRSAPWCDCGGEAMPFVHSLVKSPNTDKHGWCAPVELGEDAPQYLSFVLPVQKGGRFFNTYSCECVTRHGHKKSIRAYELVSKGEDCFLLQVAGKEFWFVVKPAARNSRRLPYVGRLSHPDFQFHLTEIQPEEPAKLDDLFDQDHTFIMGCDPFTHYSKIEKRTRSDNSDRSRENSVSQRPG
jgi:hypothetical protein